MTTYVAGVDGCPAGWIAAMHPLDAPARAELLLFENFRDILCYESHITTIAVDMPIGLPDRVGSGGRGPDREARAVLGRRQSAVFAIPSRAAVMCEDYREACTIALATSEPPRKISKQAFNLFPKIREIDAAITPALQSRVFECHPEVAFWALNGERPLDLPKKVKSRPYDPGLELRRSLLTAAGYCPATLASAQFPKSKVGPDDILDACANACSAGRIFRGEARRFPDNPENDTRGLRIEIWG